MYEIQKDVLKRKCGKDSDRTSISGKSNQTAVVEEEDEDPCDVLTTELGKVNTQVLGYLTRGAHTTCAQKGSGSVFISLMMEALF